MPVWLVYCVSLIAYSVLGASLGAVHRLFATLNLFSFKNNLFLQNGIRTFAGICILFPLWGILFATPLAGYGFAVGIGPGWLFSIGIGIAILTHATVQSARV